MSAGIKLMKISDVAEVFDVTNRTVMNWLKLGMPRYKVGNTTRLDLDEVKEWIKNVGREASDKK